MKKKNFSDKTDERLNLIGFYVCDDEKWFNIEALRRDLVHEKGI